jgi:uncharacterized membrane protein
LATVQPLGTRAAHPVHALLLAFPVAFFTGALLSDLTYLNSAEIQWSNFASWMIVGALVFGAPVLLWAALSQLRHRSDAGRTRALVYFLLLLVMWIAGLINAFKHSQDAWSRSARRRHLSIVSALTALAAGGLPIAAKGSPDEPATLLSGSSPRHARRV